MISRERVIKAINHEEPDRVPIDIGGTRATGISAEAYIKLKKYLKIIEYFIEAGIDILNPVQCSAANMEPKMLKEKFGNRIVFWGGGVNTQATLPRGTVEEVKKEVEERIKIFAPNGGFVFSAVHNIQYGTPAENIVAMCDVVIDKGNVRR